MEFGDARELSLTVNQTEYSASSTSYPDGSYVFNGFNDGKQNPSQLKFVEIAGGIKAVVWAVDIWKDVGGGRWDVIMICFTELLTPLLVSF